MRHGRCLAALLGVLLWAASGHADITNTTPYDYDSPPKPGKERGTSMPVVIEADYTYNGDGTLCERARLVGGPLDGTEFPFHTYVAPDGSWVFPTTQDIAYPCPNAASNLTGLTTQGPGFKIGRFGDDPAGSGVLPCTNP